MFRNQLTALFTHERIITTLAKAKELRPLAERMVTLAGTGSLPARRKVLTMVPDKEIVRRLFDEVAPRFTDRPGGYTRIMRLGRRRGDGAEMAIIEFVDYDLAEHEEGGGSSKDKTTLMDRAKGLFGGGAKAEAEETEDEAEATAEAVEEVEDAVETATEPEPVEVAPAEELEPEGEPVETAPAEEPEVTTETAEEPEVVEEAAPVEEVVEVVEAPEPVEAEAIDEVKAEETEVPTDEPAEEPEPAEAVEESEAVEATEAEEEKKDS
jgi:large subunit ribosomal protein L17